MTARCPYQLSSRTVASKAARRSAVARPCALPLGEAFHSRRLTLRSSQVGHVATAQRARWSHGRRLGLALSLLRDPALDVLITDAAPFDELPSVLQRLAAGAPDTLCQRIDYA